MAGSVFRGGVRVAMACIAAVAVAGPVKAAPPPDAALLQATSDRIASEIAALRGLPLLHPVERRVEERANLRLRLETMTREEVPSDLLAASDRLLHRLRVLQPGQRYEEVMLKLMGDEIAGFYDPRQKTFFLLSDMPASTQSGIMSHELYHALQDQHFGIERLRGYGDRVQDPGLAATALLEGDALATMLLYPTGELTPEPGLLNRLLQASMSASEPPAGLSPVLWDSLLFPYVAGLPFVTAVAEARGWEGVLGVYADPPLSTEQILHPERYLERDEPTWLEHPDPYPAGQRYAVDVMGEWMIRSLLEQWLAGTVAKASLARASSGWDGDRLSAWDFPGSDREVVTWLTVWDSEAEAEGFARLGPSLAAWWTGVAGQSAEGPHGGSTTATARCNLFRMERWGDLTAMVLDEGCDASAATREGEAVRATEVMLCGARRLRYPAEPDGD